MENKLLTALWIVLWLLFLLRAVQKLLRAVLSLYRLQRTLGRFTGAFRADSRCEPWRIRI